MFLKIKKAAIASVAALTIAGPASAASVDLMFVIDRSGSMQDEFDTLADNIANVLSGIAADSRIDSVAAGIVTFEDSIDLEQTVTTDATALSSALNSVSVTGGDEPGLGAMASVLPGGSLFDSVGWRPDTVRSLVLITDEDNDSGFGFSSGAYGAFQTLIDGAGYLNNVIVSNLTNACSAFGGSSTSGGCEYIPTSRPGGNAAFDLLAFVDDEEAFFQNFVNTKIDEIIDVIGPDPDPNVVPLPAAGWMLIAGLGGLAAMRRKKS
jgi:hypothetical protein